MEGASHQSARQFGWVPQTSHHNLRPTNGQATFTKDDAELMNPWAEQVLSTTNVDEFSYWVPYTNDLPPTIISRSKAVTPIHVSPKLKYPMMVALTVATIGSGSILQAMSPTGAKAAPAGNDGTGSFEPVDESQNGDQLTASPASGGGTTYQVVQGDTLKDIAAQFGVDVSSLVSANGLANPDLIHPGDNIHIPENSASFAETLVSYTVQPGDTLRGIATAHGVSYTAIVNYEANGITNPDLIHPGQELTIPGGSAPVATEQSVEPAPEPQPEPQQQADPAPAPEPEPEPQPEPQPEPEPEPQAQAQPEPEPQQTQQAAPANSAVGQQIVDLAMQFRGAPYVWGAVGPNSFDCTGFTFYITNQIIGGGFPRDMHSQASYGTPVSADNLQPGDIVFQQNTYQPGLSHAGIYIGGGQFINAANPSVGVVVSNLWDDYWGPRYHSAIRVQ
jgi:cell wall-associated NlpC family hydrolase